MMGHAHSRRLRNERVLATVPDTVREAHVIWAAGAATVDLDRWRILRRNICLTQGERRACRHRLLPPRGDAVGIFQPAAIDLANLEVSAATPTKGFRTWLPNDARSAQGPVPSPQFASCLQINHLLRLIRRTAVNTFPYLASQSPSCDNLWELHSV